MTTTLLEKTSELAESRGPAGFPAAQPVLFVPPTGLLLATDLVTIGTPDAPNVTVEYDWTCTAPKKDDDCSGKLEIWAWLRVKAQRTIDSQTTVAIDRRILPQRFTLIWEADTDGNNEVEYCPPFKAAYKGATNTDVAGFKFNHVKPITINPDPPDDSGRKLKSTTVFKWRSALIGAAASGSVQGGAKLTPLGPGVTGGLGGQAQAGLQSDTYTANVDWLLNLLSKVPKNQRNKAAEIISKKGVTEDIYCFVSSGDATLRKGEGPKVFKKVLINDDTLVKTK